ncbi:MAG: dioxygenase extradiol, partial [Pseudomonadota bacterium]
MSKLPVLFIGHGSPMNAIEDNAYRRSWQSLGQEFGEGKKWTRPKAILCVSAHWLTRIPAFTSEHHPRTIHDFGGFPKELFAQQYPASSSAILAEALAKLNAVPDGGQWGYDHGAWSVLLPMFPKADIPLTQLSIAMLYTNAQHWALGQSLAPLREQGVLIVASGNVVHNLGMMRPNTNY